MEFRERKRWGFLGLPFTFTVYKVREDMLTIESGFLSKKEEDCYMYKIVDVQLERSLAEKLVGLGTVVCYTSDTTDTTDTACTARRRSRPVLPGGFFLPVRSGRTGSTHRAE